MKLTNKRIVITGGTSGVGYELSKYLHEKNEVIVVSRCENKLRKLAQEFSGIEVYQADLSSLEDIETVAATIVSHFREIDLLINNAAVQYTPTFLEDAFKYENINREITINFTSICSLIYLLLPAMFNQKQSIILNINSGLGLAPKTTSAIYCATKAALNNFSLSLRYQLENTNIDVQQAFLQLTETPMTTGRGKNKMSAKQAALKIIEGIEKNISDHDIGKVKLLRAMLQLAPGFAKKLMKKY